jgi:hypothetical protein
MAEVLAGDAAGEVEEAIAVDVLDPRALGARDHERGGRDPGRDKTSPVPEHALRCRFFPQRHGRADYPAVNREISTR